MLLMDCSKWLVFLDLHRSNFVSGFDSSWRYHLVWAAVSICWGNDFDRFRLWFFFPVMAALSLVVSAGIVGQSMWKIAW
jgi:hypothetical protein